MNIFVAARKTLLIFLSGTIATSFSLPISAQAHQAKIQSLQQFLARGNTSMNLIGDGQNTSSSWLVIKNNDSGRSFKVKLSTYCISTKTMMPPQPAEIAERQHLQYTVGSNTPPVISGIMHASKVMDETGMYKNLGQQHTMAQLAIWEENGLKSASRKDRINAAELKEQFLAHAKVPESALTRKAKDELNAHVQEIFEAVDLTRKAGERLAQDPKPQAQDIGELLGLGGGVAAALPVSKLIDKATVIPVSDAVDAPDYVEIPAETTFVPNDAKAQVMSTEKAVLISFSQTDDSAPTKDFTQQDNTVRQQDNNVRQDDGTKEDNDAYKESEPVVVTNPDGSTTSTVTVTTPTSTKTIETTEYPNKTKKVVVVEKFKSGTVLTQTHNVDGSSVTQHVSTEEDGTKKTVTTTVNTDKTEDNEIVKEKDGNKTVSRSHKGKDGMTHHTFDGEYKKNGDYKEKKWINDNNYDWEEMKNGKKASGKNYGGGQEGKTEKGKYKVSKVDNGQLLEWDKPNGTGGSMSLGPNTEVTPNLDDDNDPNPFKTFTPPPTPPAPEPPAPEIPDTDGPM